MADTVRPDINQPRVEGKVGHSSSQPDPRFERGINCGEKNDSSQVYNLAGSSTYRIHFLEVALPIMIWRVLAACDKVLQCRARRTGSGLCREVQISIRDEYV